MSELSKVQAESTVDINRAWVTFARHLFVILNRHSGIDITYRMKEDAAVLAMSESERADAESRDFEAAALRRGYAEAIRPLQERFLSGKLDATSAESWQVIFSIQNAQFRPKPDDLAKTVRKALGIPLEAVEGHVAEQRQVVKVPKILGIPSATSEAAGKDIANLPKKATRLEQIPERDDKGNLIGEGRRKFLLASIRMKQGLRPLPSGDAFSDGDEAFERVPTPKDWQAQEGQEVGA